MLRVGVVGVGAMGRHHIRIISENPGVESAGLYDPDPERASHYCELYGCTAFDSLDRLLDESDAVCVAAPTSEHAAIGEQCLRRGVHLLMEKPIASDLDGARRLVDAATDAGVTLMVGHVERYNPAIKLLMEMVSSEQTILTFDARRLAPFDGTRCLDVDVLYDLLIHDVDLALEIVDAPIERVFAAGKPVFSDKTDFAHVTVEFAGGACAVFWTGKCSPKKVRRITVTTPSSYYEADTLENSLTICKAEETPDMAAGVCFMKAGEALPVDVPPVEPLKAELEDFFNAVRNGTAPQVDGRRALRDLEALELVRQALETGGEVRP